MVAPERCLISAATDDASITNASTSSSSSTVPRVQCTSNVVGVIPPKIHHLLTTFTTTENTISGIGVVGGGGGGGGALPWPLLPRGRVDDHSSGVSYLHLVDRKSVAVWEHGTQTLNEELRAPPPSGLCRVLTHPEHDANGGVGRVGVGEAGAGAVLLVACLGPDTAYDGIRHSTRGGGGVGGGGGRYLSSLSPRHVHVASPTTGVLCLWVLDSSTSSSSFSPQEGEGCDASVLLRLKNGEVLTAISPVKNDVAAAAAAPGSSLAWLLISTSHGRLWKVYRTFRPLTLHARRIDDERIRAVEARGDDQSLEDGGGAVVGIMRGLFDYFTTTPSKKPRDVETTGMMVVDNGHDAGALTTFDNDDNAIVALLPLPLSVTNKGVKGGKGNKSPPRTTTGTPAPHKQQRLMDVNSTFIHVVSMTSSMILKQWILSTSTSDGGGDVDGIEDGWTTCTSLIPRRRDGTLDLRALLPKMDECKRADEGMSSLLVEEGGTTSRLLEGYQRLDILATPVLAEDFRSIFVVIRISMDNGNEDATRAYVVRIGLKGDDGTPPRIIDSAWLDRYSGSSLSINGGAMVCAGLAVADEAEETGGVVAYVGFGPRGAVREGHPTVTVSAIHFSPPVDHPWHQAQPQRVKDMDINPSIVPSVVRDSLSHDPLTGGCVFLATTGLLCGAHVRFPPIVAPISSLMDSAQEERLDNNYQPPSLSALLLVHDDAVLTIKSHLQSSFRQYLVKLKMVGNGGGNLARTVTAPSVGICTSRVLSAAVVLASNDYACASSSVLGSSIPFSPRISSIGSGGGSPVTILRDKLRLHGDFVTFLIHAGAYRRVSTEGRVRLRDHGELITATMALLVECQTYFSKVETTAEGDSRGELVRARQRVMNSLEGASDDVTSLSRRWAGLQQLVCPSNGNSLSFGMGVHLLLSSASICQGIGQALRYRQNESCSLYDIPSYHSLPLPSSSYSPWTSSTAVLEVLFTQLRYIQQLGDSILSASADYDIEKADMRRYVEDLSASALYGYRDALLCVDDNDVGAALKNSYEEVKILAVSLLRRFANDQGDDLVALQTSVEHSHFEGIVQICHDHRQSWRFQQSLPDKTANERYDLRSMMTNSSLDSPYAHLHQTRDHRMGLSFCTYVLRWYADRGFFPEVFELGKCCHQDLSRYIRNDDRLSNLAWVQHLRVGAHEQATVGLLGLLSPTSVGKESSMTLWEKDQMLSLAKLSNKLAVSKSASRTRALDQRTQMIENGLTLIGAQKILQEDTAMGDEVVLDENDLLRLAVEKIQSSDDLEKIKRFAICGLSVAHAKPPDQIDAMASDASSIWHAVIQVDIEKWQAVADKNKSALCGIDEEELICCVEGTAFVGVIEVFVKTSGEEMRNVGFESDIVRNLVMDALGSHELEMVLKLSADIVIAAD